MRIYETFVYFSLRKHDLKIGTHPHALRDGLLDQTYHFFTKHLLQEKKNVNE